MSLSKGKNWEGLGGPINYRDATSKFTTGNNNSNGECNADDPTLDSCCQRDIEEQRIGQALRTTLRKYDIVAERERRRRHTVSFNHSSSNTLYNGGFQGSHGNNMKSDSGCRCSYDPSGDGGEYRALTELRKERSRNDDENDDEEYSKKTTGKHPSDDGDDVDDDDINKTMGMELRVNATSLTTKTTGGNAENESDDDDEYDYLLDEDDDLPSGSGDTSTGTNALKIFQEQRRMELEWDLFQNEIAILHGYGIHRQIHPQRILSIAGLRHSSHSIVEPPPCVVMHLVDADSIGSASLDLYLEVLATKYRGTMFVRSSGRATILLNDVKTIDTVLPMFRNYTSAQNVDTALPALVAIRNGIAVNACLQLQGLLSSSSYSREYDQSSIEIESSAVRDWLDRCGVLQERPPNMDTMCRIRPEEEALLDSCKRRPEAIEEDQRYDCGKSGCSKSFPHEHIGERNEQQDGLLISEAEILS
jgi:hypothetical protein